MHFGPWVTSQSIMHIWRDCCTIRFVAASGVGRYQNRLEVDVFWHFSFYALPPLHTLYKHIVAVKATINKQSPHAKLLLLKVGGSADNANIFEALFTERE